MTSMQILNGAHLTNATLYQKILYCQIFMNYVYLGSVAKIHFTKVLLCHTFLFVHVGQLQKFFSKIFEIAVFTKCSDAKIFQH